MGSGCGLPIATIRARVFLCDGRLHRGDFAGSRHSGRPSITMFQQGAQSTSRTVLALDIDVIPCHPKPPGVVAKFSPS